MRSERAEPLIDMVACLIVGLGLIGVAAMVLGWVLR
jgi:hypothetical protein